MERIDIKIIEEYIEKGWLMRHRHKTLPLQILNYTQGTQYEGKWDEITLNCRGIVTDTDGVVVAKGFKKFFNYEEKKTKLPETFEGTRIYDKVDGSYIQLFNYNDQWVVNSKGSFYSDHVGWAEEIFKTKSIDTLNKDWTYCFELLHPANRIVVDYMGKRDLIFLGAFNKGEELGIHNLLGFEAAESKLIDFNYEELKQLNIDNKEGYVVKFSNGERCKIKFEDYIRLHRILTEVSSYRVYEALVNEVDLNVWLEGVPDEFFNWIKEMKDDIVSHYNFLEATVKAEFKIVNNKLGECDDKTFALYVKNNPLRAFLFKLRKDRSISNGLWKMCKPELKYPF